MRESVSTLKLWTNYSKPSTQRRMMGWESDYQLVAPLSRVTRGVFGQPGMKVREPRFHSPFHVEPIPKSNRRSTWIGACLCYEILPGKESHRTFTCDGGR